MVMPRTVSCSGCGLVCKAERWGGRCRFGSDGARDALTCGPVTSQHSHTALAQAASEGHKAIVELLVHRGADLEAKDEASVAGLHWMRGGPRWASRLGRVLAMVMMRRGVVLLPKASV